MNDKPLSMPALPGFQSSAFGLVGKTQTFQSPITGQVQTLDLGWAYWEGQWTLPPMKRSQAAPWLAFLTQLRGRSGRFYGFDPLANCDDCGNLYSGVKPVPANGRELTPSDSLSPSETLAPGGTLHPGYEFPTYVLTVAEDLERGDDWLPIDGLPGFDYSFGVNPYWEADQVLICSGAYFQIGDQLFMTTGPIYAPSCGSSTAVGIVPPLREDVLEGTLIKYEGAAAIMRLTDDAQARWGESVGGFYSISFSGVEDY